MTKPKKPILDSADKLDNELSEFYASIQLMSGEVNLRKLFDSILYRAKRVKKISVAEISRETKVSASHISEYRNGMAGFTIESMEKVINYILSK